jgi:diguanylate cyclase (GGDEF)-like protein/putative nucleotidyltransferase with HDIG domain
MARGTRLRRLSPGAKLFFGLVIAAGMVVLLQATLHPSSTNIAEFVCYLLISLLASRVKFTLPEVGDSLSVNFLFVLIGVLDLGFAETLMLGSVGALMQCFQGQRPRPARIVFNVCASALASALAYGAYHQIPPLYGRLDLRPFLLVVAAIVYFVINTAAVVGAVVLTEGKSLDKIWVQYYAWSFPYYLGGAAIAGGIGWMDQAFQWESSLLVLPIVYLIYRSYRMYLGKLDDEKRHVEEMADLHMRTIEALALAIEAKDHTTHDHLQRVRVYALEVAKDMGLDSSEMEALQAASLLHDIGKLAVPEHIISKPGRLTPEEFEKMKIHPVVGAEILEHVRFPYPVVPIVRAHHEKWDGMGYPFGLKGAEIPVGARILSAVDYLDALASDRQYRKALPLEEVIKLLGAESGKAFDPKVVNILQNRYRELERKVNSQFGQEVGSKLSTEVKVERGSAPDAGFESNAAKETQDTNFLASIAAARQEAQTLFELSQDLGASLSLGETLSVFSVKIRRLVPYDAIAMYVRRGDELIPEHVSGDNFRLFASLRIPLGQGLSGWVAQNKKPIINGNPSVEPGYLNDPTKFSTLRSALSIPLEGLVGVVAVLTLYKLEPDSFTSDHLRILLAISSKMALAIENALKYEQAESSATTDFLTGLPNARSLFLQLDRELARCKRENTNLTAMVCDMDGFKQINDRFGHLEGNRVLRLFAQALKNSCREYDYVARMGGDEFVVVAPGLAADAAASRAHQLKELAKQAGREVCSEDILSLSIGRSVYPKDGEDAEALLAEADRRMYLEKQKQPFRKSRRTYPRTKCRVTIELQANGDNPPVLGNLTDISLGGCFIETSVILAPGTKLKLVFSIDDGKLQAEGSVLRIDPGTGVAVQFSDLNRGDRTVIQRVMEYVQAASTMYDNHYVEKLKAKLQDR